MALRVAVQMDPLESINIAGDSSFALMLAAQARGLVFVGIDVIGGKWLTEINVTSPTGIVAIDQFNGTDTAARIWDAIEARIAARR